ncbi:Hypothetical predicted protein [Xyrichtys novacula]|uniref:Uncharacterized protein n=1 Tax=Xyrichtys novacula TaxID=13765 RepID=A0AAV1H6N0_XYRNO|nr:Hypothetical predicted protein [Xyrichtys novacula]
MAAPCRQPPQAHVGCRGSSIQAVSEVAVAARSMLRLLHDKIRPDDPRQQQLAAMLCFFANKIGPEDHLLYNKSIS